MSFYEATAKEPLRVLKKENKKRNIISRQKIIVTLFLLGFIGIGVLLTPVFNVQKIKVTGNNYIHTDKILEISPAKINNNIFLFRKSDAEKKISELSFVEAVDVSRIFPSEVRIEVKECKPIAQVMCGQSLYLVIDKNGKILDTSGNTEKYGVPVITNMEIDEFEVAHKLKAQDSEKLGKMLILLQELIQNGILDSATSVYADDSGLHAVFGGVVDCDFGYEDNLSYRVKFVKECLKKIPENESGKITFMEEHKAVFTKEEKERAE